MTDVVWGHSVLLIRPTVDVARHNSDILSQPSSGSRKPANPGPGRSTQGRPPHRTQTTGTVARCPLQSILHQRTKTHSCCLTRCRFFSDQFTLIVPCAPKWLDFEFSLLKTTTLWVEIRSCTWAGRSSSRNAAKRCRAPFKGAMQLLINRYG